jgi:hypothetical protein
VLPSSTEGGTKHEVSILVTSFVLPDRDFTAIVRQIMVTNTIINVLTLSVLGGLAKIQPYHDTLGWGLEFEIRLLEA